MENGSKELTLREQEIMLATLEQRFAENTNRHKDINWSDVAIKLTKNAEKLKTLWEMERTGGEPDVVDFAEETGEYVFMDCSKESPEGRRSLCYDQEALAKRKANKPENSVLNMAKEMGIELLTESEYRYLQSLARVDTKTSSWIKTPPEIRSLAGALFCDNRYKTVFMYHNGADSYYSARGFRGLLRV